MCRSLQLIAVPRVGPEVDVLTGFQNLQSLERATSAGIVDSKQRPIWQKRNHCCGHVRQQHRDT